jgi:hypothetical protein
MLDALALQISNLNKVIMQRKEGIYLTQAHKIQKILDDYHLE